MAAVNQTDAIAEPDDQLGSNPAAHSSQHRPGYGVHVCQEASQLHLARMPGSIPAGQLWLDTLPHNAYRAAVHQCHVSHRRTRPYLVATSREDVPAFVELESGGPSPGAFRMVGHGGTD